MIVTCPSCDAKYRVDAAALDARGGRAKCASCGHVWTVQDEALTLSEPVSAPAPKPAPEPEPQPEPEPAPSLREKPHAAIRAREDARRRKARLAAEGAGWAGVAACLAVALAAAVLFRVDVVETWPRSAGAYAAVGLPVNPVGLEVFELEARLAEEDGAPVLIVEGEVRNVTGRDRPAPPLRAQVLGADGSVLAEWSVMLESAAFEPGSAERFRTTFPAPPEAAARVDVVLAPQAAS
jgi:predicted Zn finger-like uncharacterized protein